jgi:hypothetical protein
MSWGAGWTCQISRICMFHFSAAIFFLEVNSTLATFQSDLASLEAHGNLSELTRTPFGGYLVASCRTGLYLPSDGYARSIVFSYLQPNVWANAIPKCEGNSLSNNLLVKNFRCYNSFIILRNRIGWNSHVSAKISIHISIYLLWSQWRSRNGSQGMPGHPPKNMVSKKFRSLLLRLVVWLWLLQNLVVCKVQMV